MSNGQTNLHCNSSFNTQIHLYKFGFRKWVKKKNHSLPESQTEHYKMGLVELPYTFVMASLTTQLTWTACCRCPEGNNRLTVHWGWAGSVLDTRCGDPRWTPASLWESKAWLVTHPLLFPLLFGFVFVVMLAEVGREVRWQLIFSLWKNKFYIFIG